MYFHAIKLTKSSGIFSIKKYSTRLKLFGDNFVAKSRIAALLFYEDYSLLVLIKTNFIALYPIVVDGIYVNHYQELTSESLLIVVDNKFKDVFYRLQPPYKVFKNHSIFELQIKTLPN